MSREAYLARYRAEHRHPLNRLTHAVGIPLIVVSLLLFPFRGRQAIGLFVGGWALQFLGHGIEGNRPAFLGGRSTAGFQPRYLIVGPVWLAIEALEKAARWLKLGDR